MRPAVEDDPAVWTEEVCEAGRLPACFGRPGRRGQFLVAKATFERRSKALSPTLDVQDPWSEVERRLVAHVLPMAAGELDNPLALCVQMEADDRTLHPVSVRGGALVTFPHPRSSRLRPAPTAC